MTSITSADRKKLRLLLSLLNDKDQPNDNALIEFVRNVPLVNLNIKTLGYELARQLAAAIPVPTATASRFVGLSCKPSIQEDIESDWVRHWCAQLQTPVVFHRKIWELGYVLQAIFESGHMTAGARGLGFGCGVEPIPSYLAAQGVDVMMTDLTPDRAFEAGWAATNQHAETLAASHLGTIARGFDFVENSLRTLRPGGLSVHTTEFNINPVGETIDNWPTVLFQRKHFEELSQRLTAQGHDVAPLDFFLGDKPMDRFIDLPPYHHDLPADLTDWLGEPRHLKVGVDGFPCTCFGILVRKAA